MQNKYYTPVPEEIHIGSEIYVSTIIRPYQKHIIDYTTLMDFCRMNSKEYKGIPCLMKYLDKNDIESLGWINDEDRGMSENDGYLFHIGDISRTDSHILQYWNHMPSFFRGKHVCIDYHTHAYLKNKEELKKLMEQLGI